MKSEFDFIQYIKNKSLAFNGRRPAVGFGIGDDCAVIGKDSKTDLVITTDLLIEDIDFRLEWAVPEFLGHKALAVSLSDISAMGANPAWAMLSIGVPAKIWKTDFVERFYDGWFRLAKKFNVELIGGDISRTADKIVIDSIAAGEVKKNKAVPRSGAKAGDLIFVSGKLGGATCGLILLEDGKRFDKNSKNSIQKLLLRQLKPEPQVLFGKILSEKNLATAMIDLSDGLSGDLAHLCRQSRIGARIFADKIPLDKNLTTANFKNEKLALALDGGEDFELLFTVNPKKKNQLKKALKNFVFSYIGEATAEVEMIELVSENKSRILQLEGFRHF